MVQNLTFSDTPAAEPSLLDSGLKAALFDFDLTLTIRESIDVHRLFPERGFGGEIDVMWLRDKAFGGDARLTHLRKMLEELKSKGVELHILSFADKELIRRALASTDLLTFFGDNITGGEELEGGSLTAKGHFIKELMDSSGWSREEVLFADDQAYNLKGAQNLCLVHWVRGHGLSVNDMAEITRVGNKAIAVAQQSDFKEQQLGAAMCRDMDMV